MRRLVQNIGKHRVAHANVMDLDLSKFFHWEKVDYFYCDPPWGNANHKYWNTINYRDTGKNYGNVRMDEFLGRLFAIAYQWVKNIIWIEYGVKWSELVKKIGEDYGLMYIDNIDLLYKSGTKKRPLKLHVFGKNTITLPEGYKSKLTNTYGFDSVKKAVTPFALPGLKIFDPCCGFGYTAQIAKDTGMIFYGNEFNSNRLERTIERLRK